MFDLTLGSEDSRLLLTQEERVSRGARPVAALAAQNGRRGHVTVCRHAAHPRPHPRVRNAAPDSGHEAML